MASNTCKSDLVTYKVKVNSSSIKDTYQVVSIEVNREVNKVSSCELVISDGDPAKKNFLISESDDFIPGNSIAISVGYQNAKQLLFEGMIVKQSIKTTGEEGPLLVVTCKDKAIKMTVGRNNAYYTNTTDRDIISTLIRKYKLKADVSATDNTHKELIQYYATDWDFAVIRADINGMIVYTP